MFIKRPFLLGNNYGLTGFNEIIWSQMLEKEAPDNVLSFEHVNKLKVQMKEVDKEQKELKRAINAVLAVEKEVPNDLNVTSLKDLKTSSHKQTVFQIICDEPWFSFIRNGKKQVEGRKNSPKFQKIHVGDLIDFSNGKEIFRAIVTEIRSYTSLEDYLDDVTVQKALPNIASLEDAVKIYHQWSTPEEIQTFGFLGIFVKPV